jgi:hypothetical protein
MEVTPPYTLDSFENQKEVLKSELNYIGVSITGEEASKLSFLSRRKYERYDMFFPGESFDNRLINWLEHNFKENERQTAFEIVKYIKFISDYEMRELAVLTYENIKNCIINEKHKLSNTSCYSYIEDKNLKLNEELGKSLFIACVDDINFDFFRRYANKENPDAFQKENFVEYYKKDNKSIEEVPEYNRIFLLDQLSGSSNTAIRYKSEDKKWNGKIENKAIYYSPYLLSQISLNNYNSRKTQFLKENNKINLKLNPTCIVPISPCLSDSSTEKIDEQRAVAKLCVKYYDKFIPDRHTEEGGPAYYGFGGAGLTLILQTNCPNNTIPLIWHNFNDWYPLFPRVSHHRGK